LSSLNEQDEGLGPPNDAKREGKGDVFADGNLAPAM
jgi:hypothetical protein